MSALYSRIHGAAATTATRTGTVKSGIRTAAGAWTGGIGVSLEIDDHQTLVPGTNRLVHKTKFAINAIHDWRSAATSGSGIADGDLLFSGTILDGRFEIKDVGSEVALALCMCAGCQRHRLNSRHLVSYEVEG